MGDSDRSSEDLDLGDLYEQIARRKLLLGTVALGGGLVLSPQSDSSQSDNTNHLTEAETSLTDVAGLIDDTDLADPRNNFKLHNEITATVESVTNALNQNVSKGPKTEQRAEAIRAATEYYNALATTLDAGMFLLSQAADSEIAVIKHKKGVGYDPATEFKFEPFNESISQLNQDKKDPDTITSEERKLVPNQQQVIDSLRIQRNVIGRHLTAQQTYLDTGTTIEVGIRAHEKSNFDTAQSKLTEARESLTTGIPKTDVFYRLSNAGLTLEQYAHLFSLRKNGVSKLLSVSEESVSDKERRTVANSALDHFFEARRIVTNKWSS